MSEGCCEDTEKSLNIDFLYVDLSECDRCQSSDEILDRALRDLREQIHRNGISSITINKRKITSDEEAERHDMIRSPTLRIDGTDIEGILNEDYEVKDDYCPSCEDVAGPECYEVTGGGNECRVFDYKGETYETIPEDMIKEAIRKTVGIEIENSCCVPETTCC